MIEYVIGPVLALMLGMKFTDYKVKQEQAKQKEYQEQVEKKLVEQNTMMSSQMLRLVTPVVNNVSKINNQLGL